MIVKIILSVLAAAELFFLVWDLKASNTHKKAKLITKSGIAGAIALLLAVGVLKGFGKYFGIILLLALMALAGVRSLKKKGDTKPRAFGSVMRAVGCFILYVCSLGLAIFFPQYAPVKTTGELDFDTVTYTWTDTSRDETYTPEPDNRKVTVEFFYPEQEGEYPLAVYSHGAGGMIDAAYSTCSELASNGYVVCSIAHPYHAIYVADTEGNTTIIDMDFMQNAYGGGEEGEEQLKEYQEWMSIRKGDMNFVLDTILEKTAQGEEAPFDRIDTDKIGLFGHSLGGATSEIVGRERDDIDAVIALEGTYLGEYNGFDGEHYTYDEISYPVPLLDVNSRKIYDLEKEYYTGGSEYVNFSVVENAADAREVIFNGAEHMNFCDLPLVSPIIASNTGGTGSVDARECIENMNSMVLEFFNYYLKDSGHLDIPDEY